MAGVAAQEVVVGGTAAVAIAVAIDAAGSVREREKGMRKKGALHADQSASGPVHRRATRRSHRAWLSLVEDAALPRGATGPKSPLNADRASDHSVEAAACALANAVSRFRSILSE